MWCGWRMFTSMRISIDYIDEGGLLNSKPITTWSTTIWGEFYHWRGGRGGFWSTLRKTLKRLNQIAFYVRSIFRDEEETYDACNSYRLAKGFGIHRSKTMKSNLDQKIILRRFVCNKLGYKTRESKRDSICYFHEIRVMTLQQEQK